MWMGVQGAEGAYALINDNKYSFSVKGSTMYLTAIRSPIYCDHGGRRTEESMYTDQGMSEFGYVLTEMDPNALHRTVRAARQFNMPFTYVVENRHDGRLPRTFRGLACDAGNVVTTALKRAEDGKGQVLRAYETNGRAVDATFDGGLLRAPIKAHFTPYEIKTLYLPDEGDAREVLITEWDE